MKRLITTFCFILYSFSLFAATVKIMSFNVNGIKNNRNNHNEQKRFANICNIIKESNADIVLLQEFDVKKGDPTKEIEAFRNKLGYDSWQSFCTVDYIKVKKNKFGKDIYSAQNNIILYNNRHVVPTSNKDFGIINFKTDSKYMFVKNNTQVVEFCISGEPSKTFVVVNVHLPLYAENTKSNGEHNRLNYLHDLKALENLYYDLKLRGCKLIIGGDFNTKRANSSGFDAGEVLKNKFSGAIIDSDWDFYCYPYGGLFTCGFDRGQKHIFPKLDIDHFIVNNLKIVKDTHLYLGLKRTESDNRHRPYVFKSNSMEFMLKEDYKKYVSDHLPIMIELEI